MTVVTEEGKGWKIRGQGLISDPPELGGAGNFRIFLWINISNLKHSTRDNDDWALMSDDQLFRWNFAIQLQCEKCGGGVLVEEVKTEEIFCSTCGKSMRY